MATPIPLLETQRANRPGRHLHDWVPVSSGFSQGRRTIFGNFRCTECGAETTATTGPPPAVDFTTIDIDADDESEPLQLEAECLGP